jgi:hypothetical protein
MAKPSKERQVMTFRIDPELFEGLQRLFERDGISPSESIRRAVRVWLDAKGIAVRPKKK